MCSAIRATVLAAFAVCILLTRTAHAEFLFWPHHGSWWGDHTPFGQHSHKHRHTNPGSPKESQSSQDVPKGPTSAVVDANKPVPNMETVGPPADTDSSERAIEKPAGSDGETGPIPLKKVAPAADDQPNEASGPIPSASIDPDAPITEQLHNLASGKFDQIIGSIKERTSIEAFYAGRNYAPLWLTDGKANARAQAAIAYLGQVSADGLDPSDYPVPDFAPLTDPVALAGAEITLTTSAITYARHAQIGRVHWSRVSSDILYDQNASDPAEILASVTDAKDVGEVLAAYEPHDPAYLALKAKLAELRAGRNANNPQIADGPSLNVGMNDQRVPQLRVRLGLTSGGGATYDKPLADVVKKFQATHKLKPTGTLDAATIEALNGRAPDRQTDIVIANMERWRWMPHDLGNTYVIVNLPDYTLRVIQQGKQVWMTRIVVGKTATPTPIMSAQMKSITINPTWNIPDSIAAKEYLPLLQQDPTILQRMGLNVSYNPNGTIHLSQPPGEQNALGQIRFNFPNKFLVYQHDSNQKQFFANDRRAESHGCMRVQDPVKYAEVLLSIVRPGEGYSQDRIRRMYGAYESDIQFPTFIPVHLTYQTAFVDDQGKLEFREDIYGRDRALLATLNGAERKVADVPIQHKEYVTRRQPLPDSSWGGWAGRGYAAGNFFTRWFGGPAIPPAPVQRRSVVQHRAYYQ